MYTEKKRSLQTPKSSNTRALDYPGSHKGILEGDDGQHTGRRDLLLASHNGGPRHVIIHPSLKRAPCPLALARRAPTRRTIECSPRARMRTRNQLPRKQNAEPDDRRLPHHAASSTIGIVPGPHSRLLAKGTKLMRQCLQGGNDTTVPPPSGPASRTMDFHPEPKVEENPQ